jgi:hypothetical protein
LGTWKEDFATQFFQPTPDCPLMLDDWNEANVAPGGKLAIPLLTCGAGGETGLAAKVKRFANFLCLYWTFYNLRCIYLNRLWHAEKAQPKWLVAAVEQSACTSSATWHTARPRRRTALTCARWSSF